MTGSPIRPRPSASTTSAPPSRSSARRCSSMRWCSPRAPPRRSGALRRSSRRTSASTGGRARRRRRERALAGRLRLRGPDYGPRAARAARARDPRIRWRRSSRWVCSPPAAAAPGARPRRRPGRSSRSTPTGGAGAGGAELRRHGVARPERAPSRRLPRIGPRWQSRRPCAAAKLARQGGSALSFAVDGDGHLFYEARLRYAQRELPAKPARSRLLRPEDAPRPGCAPRAWPKRSA